MPGTLVLIALYGPRTSAGASGFGSKVSSWLGPPTRNRKMQFRSFESFFTAPWAFRAKNSGMLRPRNASDPACRKSRRVSPSQKWTAFSASTRIMDGLRQLIVTAVDTLPQTGDYITCPIYREVLGAGCD